MPTEGQFEQAGARFEAAADSAGELLVPTRRANSRNPLHGGALTRDVRGFIDETGNQLNRVAGELRDLARECRKRAQECRDAEAARGAYLAAQADHVEDARRHGLETALFSADPTAADPGPVPTPPSPPPDPPAYVTI